MRKSKKPLTAEQIKNAEALAAYWAGSISASICRDYAAGRFTTINADAISATPARKVS